MTQKNIITECEAFAKNYYSKYEKDPNIMEGHIRFVRKYAVELAKIEGADAEVLEIAAILHDIGKCQGRENHAFTSFELAKPFLDKQDISDLKKELILRCILKHSNSSCEEDSCAEVKIIQAADALGTLFDDKWQEFSRKDLPKRKLLNIYDKTQKKIKLESAKKIAAPQIEKLIEVLK